MFAIIVKTNVRKIENIIINRPITIPKVMDVSPIKMLRRSGLKPINKMKEKYNSSITNEKVNEINLFIKINFSYAFCLELTTMV